jgi:hypothetical protein
LAEPFVHSLHQASLFFAAASDATTGSAARISRDSAIFERRLLTVSRKGISAWSRGSKFENTIAKPSESRMEKAKQKGRLGH